MICFLLVFSDFFFELFDISGIYEDNNDSDNEYEISLNENCK